MYRASTQRKKAVHIVNPDTGRTFCQVENYAPNWRKMKDIALMPKDRRACESCTDLNERGPRKLSSRDFYSSWEWKKLRYQTLLHYGAVCMLCHSHEYICVDHIKPRSRYPELELDPENVQVLCNACNQGKAASDETDFRPQLAAPELDSDQEEHLRSILQ